MFSSRGFTLTEVLIAMVLMGVVILAATSVDITSRKFFGAASKKARIQDEAKIAMEHMAKNIQPGIGDMTNPETLDTGNFPSADNSRGFYILDVSGKLVSSGSRIRVKRDGLKTGDVDGKFDPNGPDDGMIEYELIVYKIRYYPDASDTGVFESLTDGVISDCVFSVGSTPNHNQVDISITVREKPQPGQPAGPENPETTLTSSIVLRAMSCN